MKELSAVKKFFTTNLVLLIKYQCVTDGRIADKIAVLNIARYIHE